MKSFYKIPLKNPVYSACIVTERHVWDNLDYDKKKDPNRECESPETITNKNDSDKKTVNNLDLSIEEKNQIKKKAYNRGVIKGKKAGFSQGKSEAKTEIEKQTKLFRSLVEEISQKKEKFYQENEVFVVKMADQLDRIEKMLQEGINV